MKIISLQKQNMDQALISMISYKDLNIDIIPLLYPVFFIHTGGITKTFRSSHIGHEDQADQLKY